MVKLIWIFVGGGLGSLCRFGISEWLINHKSEFPYPTFLANFISCFILGILLAMTMKSQVHPHLKLLFMTGFCGGFSTFSTFTGEIFLLLQNGNLTIALSYIFASLTICLISLSFGFSLMSRFL